VPERLRSTKSAPEKGSWSSRFLQSATSESIVRRRSSVSHVLPNMRKSASAIRSSNVGRGRVAGNPIRYGASRSCVRSGSGS
jgi:hypothetical protein